MSEVKDGVLSLIMNDNVSAIAILVDRLGIPSNEVNVLIRELIDEGRLHGTFTEDGKRFFKSDVKLSDAPAIVRDKSPPDFTTFNTRHPIIVSLIGFFIIAAGVIMNAFVANPNEQSTAAIIILLGIAILIIGLYRLSQRPTPS